LIDISQRTHSSFKKLLVHCRQFTVDEINREMDGFGYSTIRLQLYHILGAQNYWIGVLQGRMDADEDDPKYPTIESLERYHEQIFRMTEEYLRAASMAELSTPRKMLTWQNIERTLMPAHVIMRTVTHLYQHQGQIMAICRMLGKPVEAGMDFPIV
jgi:uncharacterized damage-inducible protein DinB